MLAVTVEFLHGSVRASAADDIALAGETAASGEWPPSPARLFAAFVAADGTGPRCHVTDGSELVELEGAGAPKIYADPTDRVLASPLRGRFVVADELYVNPQTRQTGAVQEYVGRTAALVRPGTRLAPETPRVIYVWPELDLSAEHYKALSARAARIGYVGCADSPMRVTVHRVMPSDAPDAAGWEPDRTGTVALPVPYPGLIDELDAAFARWEAGEQIRKAWLQSKRTWYRLPGPRHVAADAPTVLWLRVTPAVSGRRVLAVTQTLRRAVLDLYQRFVAKDGDLPFVLHGHGFTEASYQHAHWLALPDIGGAYSRGRIYGCAIWLPPGTPPDVVEGVRTSIWHLKELVGQGLELRIEPHAGQEKPWATNPARWTGPSRRWVSAFPVVHERWQKSGPDLGEIARWCEHAGVTTPPVAFRMSRVPLMSGAVSLAPIEVHRRDGERRPYCHLEIEFAEQVTGPIALGRARQFGLGLMAPTGGARG